MSRGRLHAGRLLAYVPDESELDEVGGRYGDTWLGQILGAPVDGGLVPIEVIRPDGRRLLREVETSKIDLLRPASGRAAASLITDALRTTHFQVGGVGGISFAPTPGTPDAAAMAFFNQLRVDADADIAVMHLHSIVVPGTGNSLVVEIYEGTSPVPGPPTFRLLGTITQANGGGSPASFQTAAAVPSTPRVSQGSYLYCQALSGAAGFDGITVDVHFSPF